MTNRWRAVLRGALNGVLNGFFKLDSEPNAFVTVQDFNYTKDSAGLWYGPNAGA